MANSFFNTSSFSRGERSPLRIETRMCVSRLSVPLYTGGKDIAFDRYFAFHQTYEFPVSPAGEGRDPGHRATPLEDNNTLWFKLIQYS